MGEHVTGEDGRVAPTGADGGDATARPVVLNVSDHNASLGQMRYVYPVVSRRAGGVSIGVNLNPGRGCNYRCLYCQVPGLVRGKGDVVDLVVLERELRAMLAWVDDGDFMQVHVPEALRCLRDVAFSGDGEPTSSPDFAAAVAVVAAVVADRAERQATAALPLIVITNGTLIHLDAVAAGIETLAAHNGRVWFKLDAGDDAGIQRVHDSKVSFALLRDNLRACAALAPTWVQTCALHIGGAPPTPTWRATWLAALRAEVAHGTPLRGVLLYSLARPSHQPEAPRLRRLDADALAAIAAEVDALGLACDVYP